MRSGSGGPPLAGRCGITEVVRHKRVTGFVETDADEQGEQGGGDEGEVQEVVFADEVCVEKDQVAGTFRNVCSSLSRTSSLTALQSMFRGETLAIVTPDPVPRRRSQT